MASGKPLFYWDTVCLIAWITDEKRPDPAELAGRAAGVAEQQKLVGEAQQSARDILAETRASLQAQAAETLAALRKQVGEFSTRLADRLIKG